ncbi:hypothetical protein [Bifidobacterium saguinibicoloris]|uniref:hypothetical protein n=1 Tax=Bifidobacterium saguinibicoloris TaxID=2834433 RepID=UPI001C5A43FA|nr:hypothetical protein [Bifidobacterium saguinibicoloris]MBW3081353.1 hypothetical protein [Bifidobacterium saguinibicoloris]
MATRRIPLTRAHEDLDAGDNPVAIHSTSAILEHRFTVSVGDKVAGNVALSWKGHVDDGEQVRLSSHVSPHMERWS